MDKQEERIYEAFGRFVTNKAKLYSKSEEDIAKIVALYIACNYDVLTIMDE